MEDQVPFNDLSRLDASLKAKISSRVAQIAVSGDYILGPEVAAFEAELSDFLQVDHCIGVASGTDALILSLLALGIGPGDTVLTMANAGSYTTLASKAIGSEPIFIDVAPDSLQMTIQELQQSIGLANNAGLKPKAVVVTHLFGQLNIQIEQIAKMAKESGLYLVEDCAQALGASLKGRMAGSFGDLATFSFYPTKNLGAAGDGGAIVGNNQDLMLKVRKLRQYGWSKKYKVDLPGGRNSRLDEIQAAILRLKLPYLRVWNERRKAIFQRYVQSARSNTEFFSQPDETYVAHLAPIAVANLKQKELSDHFAGFGVQTSIHFPVPDNRQEIDLLHSALTPLPVTELYCASLVTLPIFPEMTETEIFRVCEALSMIEV
jgi:dTDP-4-amino-4,6-dideoxygalactose transaminase